MVHRYNQKFNQKISMNMTKGRVKKKSSQSGFTLIEWMTSMIVLGIAIVSIISLQSTSLQTHMANEDTIVANGLTDQFIGILRIDALRWQSTLTATKYLNTGNSKTPMSNLLVTRWMPYVQKPVNFQMRDQTQGTIGVKARFCIFYSYKWAGSNVGNPAINEVIEVDVVTLWPRNASRITSTYRNFFQVCGMNGTTPNFTLIQRYLQNTSYQGVIRRNFRQVRRSTYIRRNIFGIGL